MVGGHQQNDTTCILYISQRISLRNLDAASISGDLQIATRVKVSIFCGRPPGHKLCRPRMYYVSHPLPAGCASPCEEMLFGPTGKIITAVPVRHLLAKRKWLAEPSRAEPSFPPSAQPIF